MMKTRTIILAPSTFLTGLVLYQTVQTVIPTDGQPCLGDAWIDLGIKCVPLAVGLLTVVQHFGYIFPRTFSRSQHITTKSISTEGLPLYSTREQNEALDEEDEKSATGERYTHNDEILMAVSSSSSSSTGGNEIRQFAYLSLGWFLTGILFVFYGLYHLLTGSASQAGVGINQVILGVISMVESTVCVVLVNWVGLGLEQDDADFDEELDI